MVAYEKCPGLIWASLHSVSPKRKRNVLLALSGNVLTTLFIMNLYKSRKIIMYYELMIMIHEFLR